MATQKNDEEFSEEDLYPENAAVKKIMELLTGMDGMTNVMALGILECVKQAIFEEIHCAQEDHPENYESEDLKGEE